MKKRKSFIVLIVFILSFSSYITLFSQLDGSQIINSCACNTQTTNIFYPVKPPVTTGVGYMKIILVYVMFDGESTVPDPQNIWPVNTTTGPNYKGKMLAQNKNDISDWWNAYDPENQMISSWFCENSRGQTHIIGDEFFVKLPMTADDYMRLDNQMVREKEINNYIYWYLDNHYHVPWSDYDKWSYNETTGWSPGPDHVIDMIYKIHRYNYYNKDYPIFSAGQYSGVAELGYGSNTTNSSYLYEISYNNEIYRIMGNHPYDNGFAGSGVTIVGNTSSGVFGQLSVLGRLMHEHGHYFFDDNHGNVGIMGDVWDLSYSPWEKIALGYVTPTVSSNINNGYEEVILDEISARSSNGKYILRVNATNGFEFILASRYKISNWDRPMLGDIAHCDLNASGGEGVYIYHNNSFSYQYVNKNIDIECADGLYKWQQDGLEAPDWDPNNYCLPLLNKIEVIRDKSDDGIGVNINQNPNAIKDGLTIRGTTNDNRTEPKYFSKGKKSTDGGCGWDRVDVITDWENWTSREFQVDRWDAWKPGYNEIFSPYSSPSTINHDYENSNTGTFIWIKEHNNSTHQTTIRIYRDATYNEGGMPLEDILEATPPSRPMGLNLSYTDCVNGVVHPILSWKHNIEPDMINPLNPGVKRYGISRAISTINLPPPTNYGVCTIIDCPIGQDPEYTDLNTSIDCSDGGNNLVVRYKVYALDRYQTSSVYSDFVSTTASSVALPDHPTLNSSNIPKEYKLNQNYPNPFNPTTNIKYEIPKDVFVTIKIYDLLGREIKTLVNENKQAGSYIVSFNRSELASGVYFYRIKAGNFVQVKRMVLIK